MAAKRTFEVRSGLSRDLGALLESGEAADVTLDVSGKRLTAHRAILAARSPVFRTQLQDSQDNSDLTIQFTDMEEGAVKQMLHFMYTDEVPQLHSSTFVVKLLTLAYVYGITRLREQCEDVLAKTITTDNASELAVIALKCSCTKLKEVTIEFIRTHNEVLATSGWENAIIKYPRIVAEICRLMVTKPTKKSTEQSPSPAAKPRTGCLQEDMAALLESGALADVALRVGRQGVQVAAHRAVLVARCPGLATKLRIKGVQPSVLEEVLRFLYTGRARLAADSAGEVLAAAERFSLPELAKCCEKLLTETLTVETAATTAVLAIMCCLPALRTAAVDLIRQHAPQVMGTDGWKTAVRDYPEVAVEIGSLVATAAAAAPAATTLKNRNPQEEKIVNKTQVPFIKSGTSTIHQ